MLNINGLEERQGIGNRQEGRKNSKLAIAYWLFPIAYLALVGAQLVWAEVDPPLEGKPITVISSEENNLFELDYVLKADPSDAEAHVLLGRIYYEKGLFDQTISEFLRASEIDPRYTEIYAMLTVLLSKENRTVDAHIKPLYGNISHIIETSKTNTDNNKAKIAFYDKHLSLLKDGINQIGRRLFEQDLTRVHLFIIRILTFVTIGLVAYTAFSLLPGKINPTKDRLERLRFSANSRSQKKSLSQAKRRETHFLKDRLYALGQLIIPRSEEARSKMKMELARAGYRRSDAVSLYSGIKVLLALAFMGGFVAVGLTMKMKPGHIVFFSPAIAGLGMYLPILWIRFKTKKRKDAILSGFPDVLDLLAVCVDAGLGLDAAIVRVSDEIRHVNRELSEEFQLLNLEIRAGKPRTEALHNLGLRTAVEDIQSLVAMLIQADKFGTSIAHSLRIHSDAARTKRRLKAEEAAAKTTVKMVFPLLLFILPALFVIVMAPAVLQIIKNMGSK